LTYSIHRSSIIRGRVSYHLYRLASAVITAYEIHGTDWFLREGVCDDPILVEHLVTLLQRRVDQPPTLATIAGLHILLGELFSHSSNVSLRAHYAEFQGVGSVLIPDTFEQAC
jgi:hypothetical protein